jgi:glutamine---fructose-6-phosphate transaminase (isomerizing)
MCGIISYIGNRPAEPILLKGLKNMEYRGYDSTSLCLVNKNELLTVKRKGEVKELELAVKNKKIKANKFNVGIAHTRWATHGLPK